MINTISAVTFEVDDSALAVKQIKDKLALEKNLMKNAVGIITCHYEFIYSGVVKAVCESLPFNVVGSITTAQAVGTEKDALMLSVMVLTSDDVRFDTAVTESLQGTFRESITKTYKKLESGSDKRPKLVLTYAPFMMENSGDDYVEIITEISGGVPCFGTLSVDDTSTFEHTYSIFNGEHYRDRMAMTIFSGNIDPKFYVASISEEKIISATAQITSSEGHILKEVNGKPLAEFFGSLGLVEASKVSYAMTSLPFVVDYNDGTPPVSKVYIGLTEEGYGICAGKMPVGSSMRVGVFDKEDVLLTTGKEMTEAVKNADCTTMLIYSCVSRYISMGGEIMAEIDVVENKIGDKFKYLMAYSGGEICPTGIDKDMAINRFHNNAFVVCVF